MVFQKTENLKATSRMIQDECDENSKNDLENDLLLSKYGHQSVSKPEDGLSANLSHLRGTEFGVSLRHKRL